MRPKVEGALLAEDDRHRLFTSFVVNASEAGPRRSGLTQMLLQ